ncbi:MAG: ketoacyl-ACP synthase III [Alistipes sp.]
MAFLNLKNVAIKGIAACVPKHSEENINAAVFSSTDDATKFIASTGVSRRRTADVTTTSSDLCFIAAQKLLSDLNWEKESIDCLIFVTQTPDYILPATSCILQDRLSLKEDCYALDISLGCSGWIYGMSVVCSLVSSGCFKRAILLAGDTSSHICSKSDKSAWPLFGDAGTATAIEYDLSAPEIYYHLASDGSGSEAISVHDGGFRNPVNDNSLKIESIDVGIERSKLHLILNGMDVFSFGLSKAPQSVNYLIDHFNLDKDAVDTFLFHQANLFMNEKIRKKLKLDDLKVPYSLSDFGNTSSASIPLTLVSQRQQKYQTKKMKTIGCGFGVGLSWGSIYFETDKIMCPSLIEI